MKYKSSVLWRIVTAEQLTGEGVGCFDGGLTSVDPDDSLYDVVYRLHSSGFHRLPVIDAVNNNVLYTLGYKRVLQFVYLFVGWPTNFGRI